MSEIRNLTRNGETFYPLTHEKAVIGMEDFKDTITEQIENYRPIEITGNVTNAPDEEDITSDANNLLKFKNRNNLYGLGKIILRRGSSFASQVTQSNTIYVIQYNFDLGNSRINIPNGSILLFEGGTLSNGTLVCADLYDVRLVYYQDQSEILSSVTLEGNFIHKACDKDTIRQILVDNSSITKDVNDVLSVKANGIQNSHLNSNVVDDSSIALDTNNKISIKDGGVTGAKLNSGVVNTDDLSIVSNKIQLADRGTTDGMGKIILRKDQSFASQLTQTNTIYVIRYDFTLTSDITIPADCILDFQGGSLNGACTVTGQNTGIQAGLVKIFGTDVALAGTFSWGKVPIIWFGINAGDDDIDCGPTLKMLCELHATVCFQKGGYYMTPTCINADGFAILGGQEHDNIESVTIFSLHKSSTNPSYILKLGGKADFGYVDDYQKYKAKHFNLEGINFVETTGAFVKASDHDPYMYGALVLDNAAAGTVNVNFQVRQVALRITATWEINFKHISLYYGGLSVSNYMIPKIYIGKPNTIGSAGTSVNACIFHNIQAEGINGPVLQVDNESNFTHNIINNVTYEAVGAAGFATGKERSEEFVGIEGYNKIIEIINNNLPYDIIPMFDLGEGLFSDLFINNITLNTINHTIVKYSDDTYLLEVILKARYYQKYILNSIDSKGAGACQNIYFSYKTQQNFLGELNISSYIGRTLYFPDNYLKNDIFFLYDQNPSFSNDTLMPHLKIKDSIRINNFGLDSMVFGKIYKNYDLDKIIDNNIYNFNSPYGNTRNKYLEYVEGKVYPSRQISNYYKALIRVPSKSILKMYAYSDAINGTLMFQINREAWSGYIADKEATITQLGQHYYLIEIEVNYTIAGYDVLYLIMKTDTQAITNLLIESMSVIPLLSCNSQTRPQSPAVGESIFDTSLSPARPIYWNGTNWVDATGTPV